MEEEVVIPTETVEETAVETPVVETVEEAAPEVCTSCEA